MRLRIPPFLPPYAVLLMVVAYAIGSLWLGLGRLDAIMRLNESMARNAATIRDLASLLDAINDIETAGREFVLAEDQSLLELLERRRREVPQQLASLRDRVRDNPAELALLEDLVPLVAESTLVAVSGVERMRSASDQPLGIAVAPRGKGPSEGIRTIVASLESRERDRFAQAQQTLARTIGETRRDLGIFAGLTLVLVALLFLAVRRLRSFVPLVPGNRAQRMVSIATDDSPTARETDAGVTMLLRDALLRAQLAETSAPAATQQHLRSLVEAVGNALSAHARAHDGDRTQPADQDIVHALTTLGQAYSRPDGLIIKATIDQSASVPDAQGAFLIIRSAAWALEAIARRKRAGIVTLQLAATGGCIVLRVHALTDDPVVPLPLTPREREEANALRQGVAARAGSLDVDDGPTGLSLALTLPANNSSVQDQTRRRSH